MADISKINLGGQEYSIKDNVVRQNIAAEYSSEKTYKANDYCLYNGELYKCIEDVKKAEVWNASRWTKTVVVDELGFSGEGISLDSPNFTGTPTAPTVNVDGYDSSQANILATLKFVMDAVAAGGGSLYSQIPIAVNTWAPDSTYPDFPYKATIPMEGVSSSTFGWLVFNDDNFATTCKSNPETGSGCVYIYATQAPTQMQYFNFWSIPTTSTKGAEIAIAVGPIDVIYDPQEVFNPAGMAIDYISADGTVTRLNNNEWTYTPTRPLTVNDKYITVSATNPNISATVRQRIYVVVGQALVTA